jgi:hypothetical protein
LIACASFSDEGGVRSPAPPGKESEEGEVKARACCAFDGWVVSESMMAILEITRIGDESVGWKEEFTAVREGKRGRLATVAR